MDLEHKNQGHFPSSDSSDDIAKTARKSKLTNFFERAHTSTMLIFISSILQIGLGLGVIFAAIAGFIQPLWFSAFLCMMASLASIVGTFLLYDITHRGHPTDELIRSAMRRIMDAQN